MNNLKSYEELIGRAALLVPGEVPDVKRSEFARGFVLYLEKQHPELFILLDGDAVFTRADRDRLNEQVSLFNDMVRKAKGIENENA